MAFDHYLAVCHPLHYPIRRSKRMCGHQSLPLRCPTMLPLACMDTGVYEYTGL
ncbi:Olfactory Receptor 2L5 [Manis pentadactyla]|nr:Olfactory Receptor 2L5 [Manis pentadactyla]